MTEMAKAIGEQNERVRFIFYYQFRLFQKIRAYASILFRGGSKMLELEEVGSKLSFLFFVVVSPHSWTFQVSEFITEMRDALNLEGSITVEPIKSEAFKQQDLEKVGIFCKFKIVVNFSGDRDNSRREQAAVEANGGIDATRQTGFRTRCRP